MGGRWYLLYSHGGVAPTLLPTIPWAPYAHPAQDTLDGNCYQVPKTAALGGRRFAAGFLCRENYAGAWCGASWCSGPTLWAPASPQALPRGQRARAGGCCRALRRVDPGGGGGGLRRAAQPGYGPIHLLPAGG